MSGSPKAYFLTCDRAGVKQGIKASRREVFRIGCNSEAVLHWSMFLAGLASFSLFYEIGQDGWPVMAMPSDQPTHFMPCLI